MIDKCKNCPIKNPEACYCQKVGIRLYCDKLPKFENVVISMTSDIPYQTSDIESEKEIKEFPSVLEQGKNFLSSMIRYYRNDFKNAPEDIYRDRLEKCLGCEFLKDSRCLKCGCFVAMKALLAHEKCPVDKWLPYERKNGENSRDPAENYELIVNPPGCNC